jgi:hypothetical protein
MELLYNMLDPEKLEKAGLGDVSRAFAQVSNQRRLGRGESTQNMGINIKIEDLVRKKEKMIDELRDSGVPEHRLEAEAAKKMSINNKVKQEGVVLVKK